MRQSHRLAVCHRLLIGIMLALLGGMALHASPSPVILQRVPARGEELQVDAHLEITFDSSMDDQSVEAAWSTTPATSGTFEWPQPNVLRYRPASNWRRDTVYTVRINASAQSAQGGSLSEDYVLEFRTVGFLEVTQKIPEGESMDIAVDSRILVMFNRPVVPLMALSDPQQLALPHPIAFSPAIAGTGEWVNTSMYVFTPSAPLTGGTEYTATIAAGLTDTTGGLLVEDVAWTFSTERPKTVWVTPRDDADLVPIDAPIAISFNMPIALESFVERFSVRTVGLFGDLFATRISGAFETDGNTVTFTPDQPLEFNQSYIIELEPGVTGAAGGLGMVSSVRNRFQTVPLPRVVSTEPENGETTAYPYTSFTIRFNAPIDEDSVLDNLTILPEPEPDELSGYFRSWDNSYIVRFGAKPSQTYEVHIGPDIGDPYGNRTGQSIKVRFQTRALDPAAWLHVPGQTGTFSTYQPSRLFVAYQNTDALELTLTRLTLADYFEATNDWYDYTPPRSGQVRQWTVPVSGTLNEVAYAPIDLLPDGQPLEPGIYIINMEADGVRWNRWQHRHLLIASPINLTMKSSDDETLVWACDLATGTPIPGLILRAYNSDGDPLEASVTDRDGIASFAGSSSYDWRGVTVAGLMPFVLGNSQWTSGISVWDFGFSSGGSPDERLFLDTDRPIYRPGQSVSFRGVLRDEQDATYSLPSEESVHVSVRSADWQLIYEADLAVDAIGTFAGQLDLTEDAPIGTYRIEVSTDSRYFTESFDVAAYRVPEFEVTVTPEAQQLVQGDEARALVEVDYFFGAPVSDQSVEWQVYAESYSFSPSQFGRYTFTDRDDPWYCWSCWWHPSEPQLPIADGAGETNAAGQLLITLPTHLTSEDGNLQSGSRTLTIEATTRGADGQVISGRSTLVVHAADFYAGLSVSRSVVRAGDTTPVDVISVDWDGKRIGSKDLAYRIIQRTWDNVFEADDAGGGIWTWTIIDTELEMGHFKTDGDGVGSFSFTPPSGGTYKVIVEGVDDAGHLTRSSVFVWASGPETVSWRRSNDDRITLITDQASYDVGETAQILIPSPYSEPHWAWVTIERAGILQREVILLESNSTVLEIPITEAHIPNIYVSVILMRGLDATAAQSDAGNPTAEMKVGYASLEVSRSSKTLHLEMMPSSLSPLPATEIAYDVWVTDADGYGVPTAIAFDLVDAAVLSLRPRTPNAILETFYGLRGLGVSTSSGLTLSINRLVAEQLEDVEAIDEDKTAIDDSFTGSAMPMAAVAEEADVGAAPPEGEARSAAAQLPEGIDLRDDFQDTAYWNGAVTTDAHGYARLVIQLPDNLTTWVARAVGTTASTEVGEAIDELLVTKPLLIRPVTPRFFVVGDRVRLLANISNQTDQELLADVTLGHTGFALETDAIQSRSIPAHGEIAVEWWGTVQDIDRVDLAFSVRSGDLSDAARPRLTTGPDGTLKVFKYTSPEIVGTAGQLDDFESVTELIVLPPSLDIDRSEIRLQLETSLAAAMQDGLDYLEHFEYECTEQVISRFLPNLLTLQALQALQRLGIEDSDLEAKLPDLVAEGLEKLVSRQNRDGGWGWWDDHDSNPYLSAYAVYSLEKASEAGFDVEPDVLEEGLDFLSRSLVKPDQYSSFIVANRQAWLAYVLAEGGRAQAALGAARSLYEERAKLSHYARAWLALTLDLSAGHEQQIDTLVSDLISDAILSATGAHWEEANYDWWAMNTDTRSTAVILDALVRLDARQPILPNVVRWLMVARKGGIWETTQETAWALIALTDWMEATGELSPSYDFYALLNGSEILEGVTRGKAVQDPLELHIGAESLLGTAPNTLTIGRGDGTGRLYYTAHLTSYIPVEQIDALQRGIIVQRQYVSPDCKLGSACDGLTTVSVGDEIQVRLTIIAPHDLYYVVVEDPFPSGCEAIDPSLATTSSSATEPGLYRDSENDWGWYYWWWWRWYSRSEFRDEKAVLFADYLPSGTYTFQYTLRAVVPGDFGVLPTLAQEFYFPEVFGRSDGRRLTVEPATD